MTDPLNYFKDKVNNWKGFVGAKFDCDDKNLRAFENRNTFRNWYGQPPGAVGESHRDEGFYTRELAVASMKMPKTIVEIGTANGIGTLLLAILNPQADLISVDKDIEVGAADNRKHITGWLAYDNGVRFTFVHEDSRKWTFRRADLYFIDGDHSFEAVQSDSRKAFDSANPGAAILWHDYNERHPGVTAAVNEFCHRNEFELQSLPDSSTVWCHLP